MTLSIRWKVALGTLFAVTLALAVAGWLALRSIEQVELSRVAEALKARTSLAVLALQPLLAQAGAGQPTSPQQIQSMVRELSRHALARVTVIGPDGTVLADSDTPDDAVSRLENHGTRPEVIQALSAGYGTDIRLSATVGQRMYYLALPMTALPWPVNWRAARSDNAFARRPTTRWACWARRSTRWRTSSNRKSGRSPRTAPNCSPCWPP
ncbi:MAG: cell wall metabolism sensor histidine kinase WalK [Nitrospirae bacterium]|nr:MAG: cell wall metabolism sensor histidine kinase WalK [Nitrospirota bacterium]